MQSLLSLTNEISRILTILLASAAISTIAHAQSDEGVFVTRLGTDTVAIERFSRARDRITGDIIYRNPRARTLHYTANLDPRGSITRFELTTRFTAAPDSAPPLLHRLSALADSVLVTEVHRGGTRDTAASKTATVTPGAVPFVQAGAFFIEEIVRRAVRQSGDSAEFMQYTFGVNPGAVVAIRKLGRDSVRIHLAGLGWLLGRIDRDGRLLGLSARGTTVKTETVRVPRADLPAIVAQWSARDAAGHPAGQLSTRDTVRATVGSAELWIDYGRPAKRGRTIFGVIVPWDSVWRTGANAATQFRAGSHIRIGDVSVPAGAYTLFSIPTKSGATLIINRQTGQWGTQYDPAQDLARIPMRVERLASPVERFTITVEPAGQDGGTLRMQWDTLELAVPISALTGA